MRLKSLELHGFKSFPDRTKLSFESGVTVIVGPNGSGKSNISDAIRWVLGELSSKNIRGNKMEDVIFGGTDSRSPMGFAEVSLTIQNSGENRIDMDYDEITVTRRYYRSGDSEYLINNKVVRLKDIVELFMNTGIGKTGYSMIGQGRISEIISQKSEDRRIIFEEAAGISKYRYKKQDAEKRLAEAEDNLERVQDILSELSSRIGPLEKDAEKAKIYLELYEEKKTLDIGLAVYDLSTIVSRREITEKDYVVVSHELEILEDTISSLEKREQALYQERLDAQAEYETSMQQEGDLSGRFSALREALLVGRTRLQHLQDTLRQLSDAYRLTETQIAEKNHEISAMEQTYTEKDARLAQIKADYAEIEAALSAAREENRGAEVRYEESLHQKDRLQQELTALQIRLSALNVATSSDSSRQEEYTAQIASIRSKLEELSAKQAVAKENLHTYEEKRKEKQNSLERRKQDANRSRAKREQIGQEISKLSGEITARQQRAATLRRMEEHFEGYSRSVKFVAEAARTGRLSGICGPVSQLIWVDRPYALAIETALGANIQNLVVEDEAAAKSAIALLKQENAGRATLYPLTSVKGSGFNGDLNALSRQEGFIGLASQLVRYEARYAGVISYLLGRTLLFDTLDNATRSAKASGYRHRIVTLDGQIINAGGSFTGGSSAKESGILTRSAEIEEILTQQKKLEAELLRLKETYQREEDNLADSQREIEALGSELSLLSILFNSEQSSLNLLDGRIKEEQQTLSALIDASGRLDEAEAQKVQEAEQLRTQAEALSSALSDLSQELNRLIAEKNRTAKQLEDCTSRKNAGLVTISIQTKEVERLAERIAEAKEQVRLLSDTLLQTISRSTTAQADESALTTEMEENEGKLQALALEIDQVKQHRRSLTDRSMELEQQVNALRKASREKSIERESLLKNYTTLQSILERINAEQDKLTERLWEDYELSYAEACEKNTQPITEESRGPSITRQNRLRTKIRELGSVNVGAVEEYKQVKERYELLTGQVADLNRSKRDFAEIIGKLETEMCQRFSETFQQINENFKDVFAQLFGGGNANLSLSDPANVLTSGIEIEVAPPGKIIKNLKLLSGGEQVFVAIAIFFAILKVNPSPFCLLDEIESALDEVNVDRFAAYARMFSANTQFIIITHRRGSMEAADTLYGVTMQERGISKILTMNVNEVEQKLGVKL